MVNKKKPKMELDQEKLIAENLSRDILKTAKSAKSEEGLRIGVEKLLEPALKILGYYI